MSPRRRPVVIGAALVALVAGGALAATLGEEDEPGRPAVTGTGSRPGETDRTGRSPGATAPTTDYTSPEPQPAASPSDEQGIERAIEDAVAATEEGRPPRGLRLGDLPGSDELSIDSVDAKGDRGSATLSSGAVVELARSGGRWRIVAVRAP